MPTLARYDRTLHARLDLNQAGIRRTAERLLGAIEAVIRQSPGEAVRLAPLKAYAEAGLAGQITAPRNWQIDPLYLEFRERQLPPTVNDAYAAYSVYTHGKLRGPGTYQEIDGQTYVEVEDD